MKRFRVACISASGVINDIPAELQVLFIDVPEIYDLYLLLEKNAGWPQHVSPLNPRLVEMCVIIEVNLMPSGCQLFVRHLKLLRSAASCCSLMLRRGPELGRSALLRVTHRPRTRPPMQRW